MGKVSIEQIADIAYASVITVPGVAGFAKIGDFSSEKENVTILTKNYSESITLKQYGKDYVIKIYLILLEEVNIRDVSQEVQIRIKYELEKLDIFPGNFTVNVNVLDLLI
ncbi:hypothetical protein P344_05690 [Spiroplasma mirum ATCC 29335]|uniref:Asp23/Gls24 family envelope stress response protein n=1 Tax=Spiroplasma mirum ATCC 29335 TaxID=838561 RepID=W0GMC1_9MOLU|nr:MULTISPECIES: Asp23/Gls24 family envelope stress response protein [Spiroplasma]AHF61332.1 hypothetical protein SMM_0952 [Spiroplasma mirum ATCC 29335]AHI58446.1 hypothetical protein P344_05690 [Spiroplasma mirum ATCC 29335]AKM53385.1 hypothetical protein SATRI_v1c10150 [Spiroplasma atrichopogonis]